MSDVASTPKTEVFIAFFGGAGDGPGLFHSQVVKNVADAGFADPGAIGLEGISISPESRYLEWTDAAFRRRKAATTLQYLESDTVSMPIVVVGHSYGAHAAIKTIDRMNLKVNHLVTIDGVSRRAQFLLIDKPANVQVWTNIFVSGVHDVTDIVARVGGHWKDRPGADYNIDATEAGKALGESITHQSFASMWHLAVPYVRQSLGLAGSELRS